MAAGVVHGICNDGDAPARVLASFGPAVGDGFETVDRSGDEPWRSLRLSRAGDPIRRHLFG
jgi:hypothetical protein